MTITLSISIAHCEARPERRESVERMKDVLLPQLGTEHVLHVESQPGKPHEWSKRQWDKALLTPRTHCVLLNDDLILCNDFIPTLLKVIEARPTHVINLYNAHKSAQLCGRNGYSWITSVDGLIGNAYVLPTQHLRAFMWWRESALVDGAVEELSEDQLINLWAMEQAALIWHTVPALVDHDISMPSCFENTQIRKPEIGPYEHMDMMQWDTDAIHVGRLFRGNHYYLLTKLKDAHGDVARRRNLIERYYAMAGEAMQ